MKIRDLVFEAPVPSNNTNPNATNKIDPNKALDPAQKTLAKATLAKGLGVDNNPQGMIPKNKQVGQTPVISPADKEKLVKSLGFMQGNLMQLPGLDGKQKIDSIDAKGVHFADPQTGKQTVMDKDAISQAITPQQVKTAQAKDTDQMIHAVQSLKNVDKTISNPTKDAKSMMVPTNKRTPMDKDNVGQLAGAIKPALDGGPNGVNALKNLLIRMQHQSK
jgi:hypothetical protein